MTHRLLLLLMGQLGYFPLLFLLLLSSFILSISISEAEMSSSDMQCSHNFRKSSWSDAGKVEDALNDFEWRNVV